MTIPSNITEEQVEAIIAEWSKEQRDAFKLMRKQLREHGVVREPMLTRMACEFADVLLADKERKHGDIRS